jgi:hypothetical protein
MNNPFFTQEGSRARNDDGTEATATWRQNKDVDDTQDLDTVYRIRFEILNDSGFTSSNTQFGLEAQKNGGAFFDVTDLSSDIQIIASQLVDEGDTTQIISSGTFATPNGGQEETNGNAGGVDYGASSSGLMKSGVPKPVVETPSISASRTSTLTM